jgi:hypothetical protein
VNGNEGMKLKPKERDVWWGCEIFTGSSDSGHEKGR